MDLLEKVFFAFAPGLLILIITSVRARLTTSPSSESPWKRSYWNAQLTDRIKQANKWASPRMERRVNAALNNLEADEAMQKHRLPGPLTSWISALAMYLAALAVLILVPDWPDRAWAFFLVAAGGALQVDALLIPDRCRQLRRFLVNFAAYSTETHDLLINDPGLVITSWKSHRRMLDKQTSDVSIQVGLLYKMLRPDAETSPIRHRRERPRFTLLTSRKRR